MGPTTGIQVLVLSTSTGGSTPGLTLSLNTKFLKMEKPKTIQEAKKEFKRCREIYKILIGEREHQIWDIEGYEHDYGKWNNETQIGRAHV